MHCQKGFSLIELAILLVIVGLIAPPMMFAYNQFKTQAKLDETRASFSDVKTAINTFITIQGRYPIPASLAAAEGDANYGMEGPADPTLCTDANWFTTDGMCKTNDGAQVLIGAVPFDALGLDPEAGEDYWRQKILYAVTQAQTVSCASVVPPTPCFTQNATAGQITIMAYNATQHPVTGVWQRQAPVNVSTNYDMVLISTGETGVGGYTNQGNLVQTCDTATPSTESENCDFDSTFFLVSHPTPSIQNTGALSLAQGTGFYDDLTDMQDTFPLGTWFENTADINYLMTLSERIGIGTTNPLARLDVAGNVQAGTTGAPANIETVELCGAGGECFDVELVGGDVASMDCNENSLPGSEPVVKIGKRRVYCATPVNTSLTPLDPSSGSAFQFTSFNWTSCGPGDLMTGIDGAGVVQCAAVP